MLRIFGAVVAALMVPLLAFGQGGLGANCLPSGAAPPSPPMQAETPPRPTLAPTKKIDPRTQIRRDAPESRRCLARRVALADGTVKSVMVAKSLDTVYGLDQAAIAAVRQWQYPPLTDGRASRPPLQIVIPFRLPDTPPAVAQVTVEEFNNRAFRPSPNDPRVVRPKLIRQAPPVNTTAGMRAKIVGTVEVDAVVLPDGTVGQVRVVKSLDKPTGLDDQALGAAREWMFTPGTLDGKPVSMSVGIVLILN